MKSHAIDAIRSCGTPESKPTADVIAKAETIIGSLYNSVLSTGAKWVEPHVTCQDDGDIVMEWWSGPKYLSIISSDNGGEYIEAERGSSIVNSGTIGETKELTIFVTADEGSWYLESSKSMIDDAEGNICPVNTHCKIWSRMGFK